MEVHELMVTVVVATMYGDVVTIGADDVCELLGIAKLKSILYLNYLIGNYDTCTYKVTYTFKHNIYRMSLN